MSVSGYSLVLAFDTDSREFVRGVEIGRVYEMARRIPEPFEQLAHAENAEMMLRVGEATGRQVRAVDPEDDPERGCCALSSDWLLLRFETATLSLGPASSSQPDGSSGTAGTSRSYSARSARYDSRSDRCPTGRMSGLWMALALSSRGLRRAYSRLADRWGFLARGRS